MCTSRKAALLELPKELLLMIATEVKPQDLASMRLTCKQFGDEFASTFGRRCLAHRRFIFSPYSLQGLVDMTAHVVFTSCVQTISFGTRRIEKDITVLLKALKIRGITEDSERMEVLRTYSERSRLQSQFIRFGHHIRLISQALENLRRHGLNDRTITLGIYDDFTMITYRGYYSRFFKNGYGSQNLYAGLSLNVWSSQAAETMKAIFTAIQSTGFPLQRIEVDLNNPLFLMPGTDRKLEKRVSRQIFSENGAFKTRVNLCIKDASHQELQIDLGRLRLELRQQVVDGLVTVPPGILSGFHIAERIYAALASESLKEICLESCQLRTDLFSKLVRDFASTLRSLKMDHLLFCCLCNRSPQHCIIPVLEMLRDDVQLDELIAAKLTFVTRGPSNVGRYVWLRKAMSLKGKDNIRTGINYLIEKAEDCINEFDRAMGETEEEDATLVADHNGNET